MTEGQLLDLRVQLQSGLLTKNIIKAVTNLAQCLKEWKENVLDKPNLGCRLCHTVSVRNDLFIQAD